MKNRLLALLLCLLGSTPILLAQNNLISEGGSTECSGRLFDTGGPDGNYSGDEDFTYVICPTGTPECIEFSLEFYDFDNTDGGDGLILFDGDRTTGTAEELARLGGQNGTDGDRGEQTGAVCFRTFASSGCLTVVFNSNGNGVERSGFSAAWDCNPSSCDLAEPITVNTDVATENIAAALRGPGAVISNITLNCPSGGAGIFRGQETDLGLDVGVLLTTGQAVNAIGPNRFPGRDDDEVDAAVTGPGDADLDALGILLGTTAETQDACVLELDIQVNTDELVFDYTFGSEEYPEFVGQDVNDIFAFFISGPGIDGVQELDGQENIAVLPNGRGTVVQIDSVNSQHNSEYYRNNSLGQSVEYDGLTAGFRGSPKTLRARAAVQACQTYHLKLAIADRGDEFFDSGVFIAALCGGLPELGLTMSSGIDYLVEGCGNVSDSLTITFDNVKDVNQEYTLQTSGTATRGVDYELTGLPETIVFSPGINELTFPITILSDAVAEGEETIVFSFQTDFGCDTDVNVGSFTVTIREELDLELTGSNAGDPVFFCPGGTIELMASGATTYEWSSDVGQVVADGGTATLSPSGPGTVTVVGTVGSCTDTLVIDLEVADPLVELLNDSIINICLGDTIQLFQTNNVLDQNVRFLNTEGFIDPPDSLNPRVVPQFSAFYAVEAGPAGGCADRDSVFVSVANYVRPNLIADTLICQGYDLPLLLDSVPDNNDVFYSFSPGSFLTDSTDGNAVYTPLEAIDTVFTLISGAVNGACADTQTVQVEVIRSRLDIPQDTIFRCLGDEPALLFATIEPFDDFTDLRWSPTIGAVDPPSGASYRVAPAEETTYFVEAIVNGCFQRDSVVVRVDSLPNTEFTLDPIKDPFCQGDTFTLRSPTYDVGDFPQISHEWVVAPGLASPSNLYNGVFFAQDSVLVERLTESGGCSRTDSIQINVIQPPILIFEPDPAITCPGEPLQLNVSFDPSGPRGELEWMDPGNTLSCTDCLDPIATINQTTTYMIEVTSEGSECSMPVEFTVQSQADRGPALNENTNICSGETVRVIVGDIDQGGMFRITGPGVDSDDPNVEVTPPADGTTYTVVYTGRCGEETETVTFNFIDNYTLTASSNGPICAGDPVTLTAQLSDGTEGRFVWTLPNGTSVSGVQITDEPTVTSTYSVTFVDDAGCGSATAEVTVEVIGDAFTPAIVATSVATGVVIQADGSVSNGQEIELTVANVPAGLDVSYSWTGNLNPPTGTGPSLIVTVPGIGQSAPDALRYRVEVTTTDGGCVFAADVVIDITTAEFEIPELVTPNGDGSNDDFRVFYTLGAEVTDYTMTVYNRWGQRIFVSSNIDEAWDGTKDGTPQNTDTYLYLTTFRLNGAEVTSEGQFSLIR